MEPRINERDEVTRESKMIVELNELDKVTDTALKYAEQLEAQLSGVLQPQPKSAATDSAKITLPPRLETLRTYRERVETVNYMLMSILSRLEV